MAVNVSVFVNVSKFRHWACRESWHATKDLAPVRKAGHSVSYCIVVCLFISLDGGFFLLLSFCLLVWYTIGLVLNAWFNNCVFRGFWPTWRIQ